MNDEKKPDYDEIDYLPIELRTPDVDEV